MGLFRRGNTWWVSLIVPGRGQVRQSTRTENKKRAERIYGKILADIEEGRWFENQSRKRTLSEMMERYEKEYTEQKDYYSKARDKSIIKNLYRFFGEYITLGEVENLIGGYEQFRRSEGAKPATVVKELGLLRRVFNVARKQWKWKLTNPVSEIELPKVRNERVRYLSEEENLALFRGLEEVKERWLKPCVTIAIDTGLRLSNVCDLQWSEVNLFSRMITISAEKMKNSDYLGIPLTERAYQTLKELQQVKSLSGHVLHDNGQRIYPVKVQRAFRKVLEEAKISDFRFHDLRHCYCSYLRQRGVDLHTIATLAGHKDIRMTKRYSHLNVDSLRAAVSKLDDTKSSTNLAQFQEVKGAQSV